MPKWGEKMTGSGDEAWLRALAPAFYASFCRLHSVVTTVQQLGESALGTQCVSSTVQPSAASEIRQRIGGTANMHEPFPLKP
jgi:hypothetical protein